MKTLTIVLALCTFSLPAFSDVLVYDFFDYGGTNVTTFDNEFGGEGFETAWTTDGGNPEITAGYYAQSLSNSAVILPITGGSGFNDNLYFQPYRSFYTYNYLSLATNAKYYFSFLMQTDDTNQYNHLQFITSDGERCIVGFREPINGATNGSVDARAVLGSGTQTLAGPYYTGVVYYIVGVIEARASTNENDYISYSIYEDGDVLPFNEPLTFDLVSAGAALTSDITGVQLWTGGVNNDGRPTRFDEIRIGETWVDVTGVTEPQNELIYDHFDYGAGITTINNEFGGEGFGTAWGINGGNQDVTAGYDVQSLSNSAVLLPIKGGSVFNDNVYFQSYRNFYPYNYLNLATNAKYYFSFLMQTDETNQYNHLEFTTSDGQRCIVGFREPVNGATNGSVDARAVLGNGTQTLAWPYYTGVVYYMVGVIDAKAATNENDYIRYSIYEDGDVLPEDEPLSYDLVSAGAVLTSEITGVQLWSGGVNNDGRPTRFDEIRIGKTWMDVTGIPEPHFIGLLLFSIGVWLRKIRS